MTFSEAIDKIMPEVQSGSKEPFIIYRDSNCEWHSDFTQNQYGETFDWVEEAERTDPFAITFTGEEFSNGSFPMVYDRVMLERLRAEYEDLPLEKVTIKLEACLNFLEENIGALSSATTDYIMRFDKPLAVINGMIPISLESPDPESSYYNEDKAEEAIKILENKVKDMINRPIDEPFGIDSERRNIEGYVEIAAIEINGRLMFIGENPTVGHSYMVSEYKHDNPLGIMETQWSGITADYVEALDKFRSLVESNINVVKSDYEMRKSLYGVEAITLTNADCVPNGLNEDLTGKLIVIKPEVLSPEYRRADYQLRVCTGGFGASPNASGRAVFCTELFKGKSSRFERQDVLGVADLAKLPQWATDRLAENIKKQEPLNNDAVIQPKEESISDNLRHDKRININVYVTSGNAVNEKQNSTVIPLPTTDNEFSAILSSVGIDNGNYIISAAKAENQNIDCLLHSATGLNEINMLAHQLNGMEIWELNKLDAILQSGVSGVNSVSGLINLLDDNNFNGFNMIAVFDAESLGRYLASDEPDAIMGGMSYEDYGLQCQSEEKGVFTDYGYIYQKNASEPVYQGIIPDEFKISPPTTNKESTKDEKPKKKPTLQEKLDKAKEKAHEANAKNDNRGDKPKKRGERE